MTFTRFFAELGFTKLSPIKADIIVVVNRLMQAVLIRRDSRQLDDLRKAITSCTDGDLLPQSSCQDIYSNCTKAITELYQESLIINLSGAAKSVRATQTLGFLQRLVLESGDPIRSDLVELLLIDDSLLKNVKALKSNNQLFNSVLTWLTQHQSNEIPKSCEVPRQLDHALTIISAQEAANSRKQDKVMATSIAINLI